MKINTLTNLWSAYNEKEDFRILIVADDEDDAMHIATQYAYDTNMNYNFRVTNDFSLDDEFDCDYAISLADYH